MLASFRKTGMALVLALASAMAQALPITFQFNFMDAASEGFNDLTYGAARRSALQYAGNSWGSLLQANYAGETIRVSVYMDPLGSTNSTLASAASLNNYWDNTNYPVQNTIYAASLANHFRGRDLNTAADEIKITFNGDKSFYYGTDAQTTSTSYDFVSLSMHELGHGLGFSSRIDKDYSDGSIGGMLTSTSASTGATNLYPSIYDRFLVDVGGTSLLSMTDAGRAAVITSGALYWSGAKAIAANGGVKPKLYAPATPAAGSSIVHLDPSTHFLLDPNLARGEHVAADPVTLGMLADMGWTVTAVPEPASWLLMFGGLACVGALARRRVLS